MSATKTITATEARKRWFEILNRVHFAGEEFVIEKNNMPLVRMVPEKREKKMDVDELIRLTCGFLKHAKKNSWPSRRPSKADRERDEYVASLWKK